MDTTKAIEIPTTNEVRIEAITLLIDNLGLAKAAIFIREQFSQKTDYLITKQKIFNEKSVDEIYANMEHWKKGKHSRKK